MVDAGWSTSYVTVRCVVFRVSINNNLLDRPSWILIWPRKIHTDAAILNGCLAMRIVSDALSRAMVIVAKQALGV